MGNSPIDQSGAVSQHKSDQIGEVDAPLGHHQVGVKESILQPEGPARHVPEQVAQLRGNLWT